VSKRAIIDAKAFSEGLDQVSKALRKMTYPALSEICVRFEDGTCILTATDMETWLIKRIPAQGEDMAFVFSRTKDVAKACRLFHGALILELEEDNSGKNKELKLLMRCGSRSAEFDAMDSELYPDYKPFVTETSFSINAASLHARIERVDYAAMKSWETSNATRSSVQFSGSHVFALDGNRLACDTDPDYSFPRPFMANRETLPHLKLFGDQEVLVEFGKGRCRFTNGAITLDFIIPSMDIFGVDKTIPQNFAESFTVNPGSLLRELKYLKEFTARERYPYVRFCSGDMFMPASSGTYRTRVEICGESSTTFAFELNRMIDAMRQFKDEPSVRMNVNSSVSPFVITAEGRSDLALVCPVRLTDRLLAA